MSAYMSAELFRDKHQKKTYTGMKTITDIINHTDRLSSALRRDPSKAYAMTLRGKIVAVALHEKTFELLTKNRARYNRVFSEVRNQAVVSALTRVQLRHLSSHFPRGKPLMQEVLAMPWANMVLISPFRYAHLLKNASKRKRRQAEAIQAEVWRTEVVPVHRDIVYPLAEFLNKHFFVKEGITAFKQTLREKEWVTSPYRIKEISRYNEPIAYELNAQIAKKLIFSVKHGPYAWSKQKSKKMVYMLAHEDVTNLHLYINDLVQHDAIIALPSGTVLMSHSRFWDAMTRLKPKLRYVPLTIGQYFRKIAV